LPAGATRASRHIVRDLLEAAMAVIARYDVK
jgi:hypothetical protein